jgi:hypothetical protein
MKKSVFYLGFGILTTLTFSSCLKDDNNAFASYGVIQNVVSANNYEILTDKGNTLVVKYPPSNYDIFDGKRVRVNFDLLSDKESNIYAGKVYDVKVNWFYLLLSKPTLRESFILEDEQTRRDSIGNDSFGSVYAWFGGDYININFEILHSQFSTQMFLINLVYDDTQVLSDTLYLSLHQNAYEREPRYMNEYVRGLGRCSFKISGLLPEGVASIPVKLSWTEYGYNFEAIKRSDSGIFTLGKNDGTNISIMNNDIDNTLIFK